MTELALSVVIAARDAARTLPDQLAALTAQTPDDAEWEVIVSDNGSTDETASVVAEWRARLPGLRLIDSSARPGPAGARNTGVAAARAAVIAFCDADDVIAEGWVAAVREAMRKHVFAAGRFDTERFDAPSAFQVSWSPQTHALTRIPYMPGFVTAGAGNMAIRRDVFEAVGGFDEALLTAEDDDLCLRVQLAGHPLAFVPAMLLHVRRRSGLWSIWRQSNAYGRGARRLEHRYARVTGVRAPESASASQPAPAPTETPRLPERIANLVWRYGWARGRRRADLTGVRQLRADGSVGS